MNILCLIIIISDVCAVENDKSEGQESFLKIKSVSVVLWNFDIQLHHTRHPIRNFFTHPWFRLYMESHLIQVLETQIYFALELIDFELYQLNARATQGAPNLLAYIRALFSPAESTAKGLAIRDRGVTKVGKGGSSVLSIGVEDPLLPGKLEPTVTKDKGISTSNGAGNGKPLSIGASNGDNAGITDARDYRGIVGDIGTGDDETQVGKSDALYQKEREEAELVGWESTIFDF